MTVQSCSPSPGYSTAVVSSADRALCDTSLDETDILEPSQCVEYYRRDQELMLQATLDQNNGLGWISRWLVALEKSSAQILSPSPRKLGSVLCSPLSGPAWTRPSLSDVE